MKVGRKSREMISREWVGPRCSRMGTNKSMSDMLETTNNKGMFTLTFRSLDVALPVIYPTARCPTANVYYSSLCCGFGHLSEDMKLNVLLV
jgi:hypothetical protein